MPIAYTVDVDKKMLIKQKVLRVADLASYVDPADDTLYEAFDLATIRQKLARLETIHIRKLAGLKIENVLEASYINYLKRDVMGNFPEEEINLEVRGGSRIGAFVLASLGAAVTYTAATMEAPSDPTSEAFDCACALALGVGVVAFGRGFRFFAASDAGNIGKLLPPVSAPPAP